MVFVSDRMLGVTTSPDALCRQARAMRRDGRLPVHTSVTWRLDGIHVDSVSGMMMMPLLIVSELPRAEQVHAMCRRTGECFWDQLLQEGVMEYISTQEAFQTVIAPSFRELLYEKRRAESGKPPRRRYTHLVPHPSMILGIASAFEPFLEHNQGPRTTYAANMLSQIIGFGPMMAGVRGSCGTMEKTAYRLWYPQRSVCTTLVEDALALSPMGQTMLVAVMDHPHTMEDAS